MIKNTLFILTILFFTFCNQVNTTGESVLTQAGDTISKVDISVKYDTINKLAKTDEQKNNSLIFKASGSEPGWFAEFYNNKLRLVVDYGKDSLLIDDTFVISESDKAFVYSKNSIISGKNSAIAIAINNKPCTSASGDKESRSISIKYNNKEYKGCGSFIK